MEELVEDFDITEYLDESGNIILKKLIFALKNDYNFPLESNHIFIASDKEIHFYLSEGDIFMNCGLDPLN